MLRKKEIVDEIKALRDNYRLKNVNMGSQLGSGISVLET